MDMRFGEGVCRRCLRLGGGDLLLLDDRLLLSSSSLSLYPLFRRLRRAIGGERDLERDLERDTGRFDL